MEEEEKQFPGLLLLVILVALAIPLYIFRPQDGVKEETKPTDVVVTAEIEEESPQTKEEYLSRLKKKASSGDANAMFRLGNNYRYGYNDLKPDNAQAIKWYKKAIKRGDGDAMNTLASMYGEGEGVEYAPKKAFDLYIDALEHGSEEAAYNLSRAYYKGLGVDVDYLMSGKYLAMSAKGGNEGVQEVLDKYSRKCHETRVGAKFYYDMKSCYMAAHSGDLIAMHAVALSFYEGQFNQIVDHEKAFEWFQKSAEAGHSAAQYYLAMLYDKGFGTQADKIESYAWVATGLEQKDYSVRMLRKAKQAKEIIYAQLSEEERVEADEKLKAYIEKYVSKEE